MLECNSTTPSNLKTASSTFNSNSYNHRSETNQTIANGNTVIYLQFELQQMAGVKHRMKEPYLILTLPSIQTPTDAGVDLKRVRQRLQPSASSIRTPNGCRSETSRRTYDTRSADYSSIRTPVAGVKPAPKKELVLNYFNLQFKLQQIAGVKRPECSASLARIDPSIRTPTVAGVKRPVARIRTCRCRAFNSNSCNHRSDTCTVSQVSPQGWNPSIQTPVVRSETNATLLAQAIFSDLQFKPL